MEKDGLNKIVDSIANLNYVDIEDIPDINLYMDQVLTFMEESLSEYKRDDKQKIMTKSMINNYVKNKLIAPPTKKKYDKTQIISLILIYQLKSILSINDIALILDGQEENIKDIYAEFLENKESKNLSNEIENLKNIQNIDKKKLIFIILMLIEEANQRKILVEKIIDLYFSKN